MRTLILVGFGVAFLGFLAANILSWPIASTIGLFGFGVAVVASLFAGHRDGRFPIDRSGHIGDGGGDGGGGDGGGGGGD